MCICICICMHVYKYIYIYTYIGVSAPPGVGRLLSDGDGPVEIHLRIDTQVQGICRIFDKYVKYVYK